MVGVEVENCGSPGFEVDLELWLEDVEDELWLKGVEDELWLEGVEDELWLEDVEDELWLEDVEDELRLEDVESPSEHCSFVDVLRPRSKMPAPAFSISSTTSSDDSTNIPWPQYLFFSSLIARNFFGLARKILRASQQKSRNQNKNNAT
eukprot:Lithocolla_globosa_v1_NODE_800_length_3257_cov_25.478763.p3 type:complete len:149 gc:universal NODE_800_length_3257_cov_25.478763:2542-2988(+)